MVDNDIRAAQGECGCIEVVDEERANDHGSLCAVRSDGERWYKSTICCVNEGNTSISRIDNPQLFHVRLHDLTAVDIPKCGLEESASYIENTL